LEEIKTLIEAALFASGRQLSIEELAKICGSGNIGVVRRSADQLLKKYEDRNSAIEIQKIDNKYVMRVRKEFEGKVMHLIPETEIPAPVLKTLAFIAYEQPIKQSDLVRERGNNVYKYIRFLRRQGFVEAKRAGRTRILTVTSKFKEYFQIKDTRDLKKFIKENSRNNK